MKKVVVFIVFLAAALPLKNYTFCQELDSLILTYKTDPTTTKIRKKYLEKSILEKLPLSLKLEAKGSEDKTLFVDNISIENYGAIHQKVYDDPRITHGFLVLQYSREIPKEISKKADSLKIEINLKQEAERTFVLDSETILVSETVGLYETFKTKRIIKRKKAIDQKMKL